MRQLLAGSLILSALLAVAATVDAQPRPAASKLDPASLALAETIVIGRVVGMEDTDVVLVPATGAGNPTTYRIAIVSVSEVIKGKKELKQLRVGFTPSRTGLNAGRFGGVQPLQPGQLAIGVEGLFFLQKQAAADFLVLQDRNGFIPYQPKASFDKCLDDTHHALKLFNNPMAGLKSKDAKDRYLTAALLIMLYRSPRVPATQEQSIGAEESKLILEALAESDRWKTPALDHQADQLAVQIVDEPFHGQDPLDPMRLFRMLGVTKEVALALPAAKRTPDEYAAVCRQWCQKNAATYRIKRFVDAQ